MQQQSAAARPHYPGIGPSQRFEAIKRDPVALAAILRRLAMGEHVRQVARDLRIPVSALHHWLLDIGLREWLDSKAEAIENRGRE